MSKHLAKNVGKSAPPRPEPREERERAPKRSREPEEVVEKVPVRRAAPAESYEDARTGRKEKRTGRKVLVVIIIVVALLIILAELAYIAFGTFYNKMNFAGTGTEVDRTAAIASYVHVPDPEEEEEIPEDAVIVTEEEVGGIQAEIQAPIASSGGSLISNKDVVNILLVGTDARTTGENARSDVMMLVSLNKASEKIVLTSFMRDIYAYIPDYGYDRLNAAYAIAGADYLIDTLEADFGVDINNFATVNFYAFADMIDAVGGIDLELTNAEVDFINEQAYDGEQAQLGVGTGSIYLDYSADGRYHLNGTQALAHCRNRSSSGSDFDRTSRQRTTISCMIEKAKTLSLTELYSLANTVLPMITTDMTQGDCLSLLLKSAEYLNYEVVPLRIPADSEFSSAMINGMSVLSIDFAASSQLLQETIYS